MATIASQLQALRSFVQVEPEQTKRPFVQPSIIYDPKQAADIDRDSLFNIALSGLDALVGKDKLFGPYKNDLFSDKSRELDRELLGVDENDRINASVSSYLRLLSGYLYLPSALKTLEYLIRRYKIHVYNKEELILCALPYHDTHSFVRIVQIISTGNSKWKFLDGVKTSGAPLPRKVIVQQCIRDMGILEVLCDYASPSKKSFPSKPVINFCTAVVVETLGSVDSVDNDVVTRLLPFVMSGLQFGVKRGLDHKAGAMMIIVLLANRAALHPKVLQSLMRLIIAIALEDARESTDLQWVRMAFMALVNLVQLQSVDIIHQKALKMLKEIRDLPGILNGLIKEFNIERFLVILLDSLIYHSSSDDWCHHMAASIIDTVPIESFLERIVFKVLHKASLSASSKTGTWAKHILDVINKNHAPELLKAVHKFMESTRGLSKKEGSAFEVLCRILDVSAEISDSKIFLALEHPKAEVRCVTLKNLDSYENLQDMFTESQRLVTIKDAILRRLGDDDLTVVQSALSLKCLSKILTHQHLLEASKNVLQRCVQILISGVRQNASLAGDVAISCLELAIKNLKDQSDCRRGLATMMFPLLLILPRSERVNLTALNLSKEVGWPIYENIKCSIPDKKLEKRCIPSINMDTVNSLAASLSVHFEEYMPWIIECCCQCELSKTIFFLVLMQSFVLQKSDSVQFYKLLDASFPVLRSTWEMFETSGIVSAEGFNAKMLDWDCRAFLDHLLDTNLHELNTNILACVFWKLLENVSSSVSSDIPLDCNGKWLRTLENLFVHFAVSQSNHIFKKHLQYLVTMCMASPVPFLSNIFTGEGFSVAVQVESLQCFRHLCSQTGAALQFQLLSEFPSVLVPLCSDNQVVQMASMKCIEELHILLPHIDTYANKGSSSSPIWSNFLAELLGLMVQQKKLLLLDKNYLSSFFTSLLSSSSSCSLLFPESNGKRFDQSTKEDVLRFILESVMRLSAKAKLKIFSLVKGLGSMIMLVKDVELLLRDLLRKREQHYFELNSSSEKLSMEEVQILCILLECCGSPSSVGGLIFEEYMLKALQVDVSSTEDPAIIQPCVAVLQILSKPLYSGLKADMQEMFFRELVLLFRNSKSDIQNASREALLRINITCCTISNIIESVLEDEASLIDLKYESKKKKPVKHMNSNWHHDMLFRENALSFISSLLDVVLMKKDIENRVLLIKPLFMLLRNFFGDKGFGRVTDDSQSLVQASSGISQTDSSPICFIQQTLLLILQDISTSLKSDDPLKDDAVLYLDVGLLVQCAQSTKDAVTRNHVFSLLSTVARVCADKVSEHIVSILAIIGESVVMQFDSCSKSVIEDLISVLVPCWLSKTDTIENLLQTFINVLPDVAAHTRLSIVIYLIRTLGEQNSLGSVLVLLFRSLLSRKIPSCSQDNLCDPELITSIVKKEWEYTFALDICEQYSCMIWLPSLVSLLQKIGNGEKCLEVFMELLFVMHFVLHKLQDPQFTFQLASMEEADNLQNILVDLVEQVVCHVYVTELRMKTISIPSIIRKKLNECLHTVLRTITIAMRPSAYYRAIIKLLVHEDRDVRKKALGLLCETVRDKAISNLLHLDEDSLESFKNICGQICKLIDEDIDSSNAPLKLAAVTTLEVLASKFSGNHSVFSMCLGSVSKSITSRNLAISSCCLRTAGALISVLGPRSLSELPHIMEVVLKASHKTSRKFTKQNTPSISQESYMLSILYCLEVIVDKLGGFLNPYLRDIIKLLVLRPDYVSASDPKLMLKGDTVRRLVAEKIPVRLLVPALLDTYSDVVNSGDSSLSAAFEILANLISTMDKASVSAYHAKIYGLCLQALDLRRLHPISIKNINVVETRVINAMIVLTMKLTETMFKPLFIRSIEWAELNKDEGESTGIMNTDRALSFYGLVNKLAENHRSLFVPYFKYLLEDCIKHLMSSEDTKTTNLTQKKKKAKLQEANSSINDGKPLSLGKWHLRALVLSSLHKCFIFDAGSLKFLDSNNFQLLLKPIVSQLAAEPPVSLEEHLDIPLIKDVDDLLVSCIGQMAITAGNDLLWKPLNHEVLMQTRSEAVRARVLGLRVVKGLVENLKEEYMVFLAETIPFLGELLEDVEPSVKSLAQEILREMESISGESIRQYL